MTDFRQDATATPTLPLWDIVRTSHVVERAFTRAFGAAGLTPQQYGVLASLADDPGCTRAELARNALVRPQSLARLVDRLLDEGLLEQDGPRGRGRRAPLRVTAAGMERLRLAWPNVVALNEPAGTGLDEPQATALSRALSTIREHLDEA